MKYKNSKGYSLTELMLVVIILGIMSSIIAPNVNILLIKAFQGATKGQIGALRSSLSIHYADTGGEWPLHIYPAGRAHQTAGTSLTEALVPDYIQKFPPPMLKDSFSDYDGKAAALFAETPPKEAYINHGPPAFLVGVDEPFGYDNKEGFIYVNNVNLDTSGDSFYHW